MEHTSLTNYIKLHHNIQELITETNQFIKQDTAITNVTDKHNKKLSSNGLAKLKIQYQDIEIIGPLTSLKQIKAYAHLNSDLKIMLEPQDVWDRITKLDLSRNLIFSLRGLNVLKNLKSVNLSYNKIDQVQELVHISNKHDVSFLYVGYNPLTNDPNYRLQVVELFENLEILDDLSLNFKLLEDRGLFQTVY